MPMLKTVRVRAVAPGGAAASLEGIGGYLVNPKSYAAAAGALRGVGDYLRHGRAEERTENRAVVSRDSENLALADGSWFEAMLNTKLTFGKLEGRPYYHFVVSPDPDDRVGPEEVADLAAEWVEACYPGSEWHIDVHTDNANRIPHAHVIVNSVLPESGRKVQRSNRDVVNEARTLQSLAEGRGLSVLPDLERKAQWERHSGERAGRMRGSTAVELVEEAMRRDGRTSWRAEIRDAIDDTARHTSNWEDFVAGLGARGVDLVQRRRGITFVMRDFQGSGPRRIKGSTLGRGYTKTGLLHRLDIDWDSLLGVRLGADGKPYVGPYKVHYRSRDTRFDERARERRLEPQGRRTLTYAERMAERAGRNRRWRSLDGLIDALWAVHDEGVSGRRELAEAIAALDADVSEAERQGQRYSLAVDRALEVVRRARAAEEDEAWLGPMEGRRVWSPTERREVKARRARLAENRQWVDEQLEPVRDWLDATGHDPERRLECALDLARDLRENTERLGRDAHELRGRLARLRGAEGVLSQMYTKPLEHDRGIADETDNMDAYEKVREKGVDHLLEGMRSSSPVERTLSAVEFRLRMREIGRTLAQPNLSVSAAESAMRAHEARMAAAGKAFSESVLGGPEEAPAAQRDGQRVPSATQRGVPIPRDIGQGANPGQNQG